MSKQPQSWSNTVNENTEQDPSLTSSRDICTVLRSEKDPIKPQALKKGNFMRSSSLLHGSVLYCIGKTFPRGPLRSYFTSAPTVKPKWFYATDAPISMPVHYLYQQKQLPEQFQEFSEFDNDRLESIYQKLKQGVVDKPKVPVNEDFLFEVDLEKKEMSPVYWEGAIYEIRRGVWFSTVENKQVPVSNELTAELEKAYRVLRPYEKKAPATESPLTKSKSYYELQGEHKEGRYVVFTDHETAYVVNDVEGIAAQVQLTLIKNTQGAAGLGGVKITRGLKLPKGKHDFKNDTSNPEEKSFLSLSKMFELEVSQMFGEKSGSTTKAEDTQNTKQAMSLEIENDYKTSETDGNRKIDHLIFCVHGIGQVLGTKFQAVNFTHTINILRKNLKKVYKENEDLKSLKSEDYSNCGIQVLPVTWRHKVDFSTDKPVKSNMPSLADITVDEIKPLRNILGSVLLDVLLYYEPRYLNQILDEVVLEINRIYRVFKERNPDFNGRISIVGHSLGSAISFDLLSLQAPKAAPTESVGEFEKTKQLDFTVDNFFAIGSPVGVFNLLKHKKIGSLEIDGQSTPDISVPRCGNLYNIFHPCDPIAYRMEPLVSQEFSKIKPDSVPFLIENFDKHISSLANLSDKVFENATKTWTNVASKTANSSFSKMVVQAIVDSSEEQEPSSNKNESISTKENVSANDHLDSQNNKKKSSKLTPEQYTKLVSLNKNGRVDYALQQGLLDLSIISSISAHISYFEDENIAAFLLRETLNEHKESLGLDEGGLKKVRLY